MRIIYIHQFFATNDSASGTRSYDVARYLARWGHSVTMICGTTNLDIRMRWWQPFRRVAMDGFDVVVCHAYTDNKHGGLMRMIVFAWFALLATIAACLRVRRVDVVFATSLPLTVGIPGFVASRWHRARFVFEVRDIFPEGDVISGNLRAGSLLVRVLEWLENFCYAKADRILLVSPGFQKRLIERGYDGLKMRTILLGADKSLFETIRPDTTFRERHGLAGKTVAIYTGAHGRANGLYYILDAAELLKERDDIAFVLIGDGREKLGLREQVRQRGLANVHLLDPVPKTQLAGILADCDIGLMILADVGERPVVPNKIFDYMFSELPSIVNFTGPTIEMVEQEGAGVFADPKVPQSLADRVVRWADNPDEAKTVGRTARQAALSRYDREHIAAQIQQEFAGLLAERTRCSKEAA